MADDAFFGTAVPLPTTMAFLAPRDDSLPADTEFNRTLRFTQTTMTTSLVDYQDDSHDRRLFPNFALRLISDGDDLIPLDRGVILTWRTSRSFWDVVVGAGKRWREPGDGAWNRASLPLTLVSRRVGQAKNCVLQFLFDAETVSNAYVQCNQETSPIDVFQVADIRVLVPTEQQELGDVAIADAVNAFRAQRVRDLESRPWSFLATDFGVDPAELEAEFNSDLTSDTTLSYGGLLIDGVLYQLDAQTRSGPYPYPRDMRHGVFSVTKTLSASLSMLYLAQRYGEAIFDARVADYVPALAGHPGWQGVTFEHTLNMMTGTDGNDGTSELIEPFLRARDAEAGIAAIAAIGDAPPAPGVAFSYASTHTFVLSYAMHAYVAAREGEAVDYFDLVQANVLDVIGVFDFALQRTLENDDAAGVPTMGWGAYPTADDAAKIALLLQNDGEYLGQQLLHRKRTRDATGKSGWPGYEAGVGSRYRHAFWAEEFTIEGCTVGAHAMQGHGGNYVALLSSGVIILRFMDHNAYRLSPMARAAERVRPTC